MRGIRGTGPRSRIKLARKPPKRITERTPVAGLPGPRVTARPQAPPGLLLNALTDVLRDALHDERVRNVLIDVISEKLR